MKMQRNISRPRSMMKRKNTMLKLVLLNNQPQREVHPAKLVDTPLQAVIEEQTTKIIPEEVLSRSNPILKSENFYERARESSKEPKDDHSDQEAKPRRPSIKRKSPTKPGQSEEKKKNILFESMQNSKLEKVEAEPKSDEKRSEDRAKAQLSESKPLIMSQALPDGFHTLEFENGRYIGFIKDNKRNGKGKYIWKDGNEYEGDWVDDLKEGNGTFRWACGDIYEGQYTKDKREGTGLKTYINGDTYEVFFSNLGRMDRRKKTWQGFL